MLAITREYSAVATAIQSRVAAIAYGACGLVALCQKSSREPYGAIVDKPYGDIADGLYW